MNNIQRLKELKNLIWNNETTKIEDKYREIIKNADTQTLQSLKSIMQMSKNDSLKAIDELIYKIEKIEEEKIKEAIKEFGVDISEIEHKRLDTGIEVFSYYDMAYGRKRILENPIDGKSLVEQLKDFQNKNESYQGEKDYKQNAYDIVKKQTDTLNCELKMIPISEIYKYDKVIDGLTEKRKRALDHLLEQKDSKKIAYVNIENALALDSSGNMIESAIVEDKLLPGKEEIKIETPKDYRYSVEEISNEEKVRELQDEEENMENQYDQEVENNQTAELEDSDLEDIPKLIEAELQVDNHNIKETNITELKNKVVFYYNNPDAMLHLSKEEMEFYEKFVTILSNRVEQRQNEINTNQMQYNSNGFLNIIFASIIIIVLVIMTIIFINK